MSVAGNGQLNSEGSPAWGSRSIDCFEKLEQIGEGTYGQVFMAKDKATGEIVALKKVRMDNEKKGLPITATREINILRKLNHDNVIKLKDIVTSKGPEQEDVTAKAEPGKSGKGKAATDSHKYNGSIYMVFEYMDHDLAGLAARPGMRFTVPQIKCYMKQLLTGLHYCHVNQVIHRDIKGSNLLIDNNGILKLADFGLARTFSNDSVLTNRVVTLWYRPPELLMGSTRYGPAVDMWSVGCIFAELLSGRPILLGKHEMEQNSKIFELCGSPDEEAWPGVVKLPWYSLLKPKRRLRRRVRDQFRHTLGLVQTVRFTLNPAQRITAKDALDADYFWTDPMPCAPSSLPKYDEASHEYQTKRKRQQSQQQDEMAKRQKTFQQQLTRPLQQQGGQDAARPGPGHPGHNSQQMGNGSGYQYGGRGPAGPQRHNQGGRPPQGGYNAGRGPGDYGGRQHQQVPAYRAPNMVPQAGRESGFTVCGGYPQAAPCGGTEGQGGCFHSTGSGCDLGVTLLSLPEPFYQADLQGCPCYPCNST